MGEFTVRELEFAANSALEFYMNKGSVADQAIQNKPLLKKLRSNAKSFPGGKDNISVAVQGQYPSSFQGFVADDEVTYGNPTEVKRAIYPWKLVHDGIKVTMHELLKDGISIVDTTSGKNTSEHSKRDLTVLVNMFENKISTFKEGNDKAFNLMCWRNGTQDPKLVPGVTSFIVDDPTAAVNVGGLDQATNTWWRNYAALNINASTPSNQNLTNALQKAWRQMMRYANTTPQWEFYCGSDFLEAYEKERREKGTYSLDGFMGGQQDNGMADTFFKKIPMQYDPTLDDEGKSKFGYLIDHAQVKLMPIDGEDNKNHSPARPEDKYVLYRAMTWVGGLVCTQRNTSGVFSIA